MVIPERTGEGKTLCFGIPILDIFVKHLDKHLDSEIAKIKGQMINSTRELAIQIKDHIEAVIPSDNSEKIQIVALVGGMSIDKQLRLLNQKPAIIVATPGRLCELMSEYQVTYLL